MVVAGVGNIDATKATAAATIRMVAIGASGGKLDLRIDAGFIRLESWDMVLILWSGFELTQRYASWMNNKNEFM